ncbi:cytochrome P450 monooxygenase phmB [Parastagonospora nodorum]|nr:cytochrome P450 monooxygenase phmB [Parastagonospora nodorum]
MAFPGVRRGLGELIGLRKSDAWYSTEDPRFGLTCRITASTRKLASCTSPWQYADIIQFIASTTITTIMLESLIEQWQIMRQAFAPMRLSRWQLVKLLAAQIHRDNPVAAKIAALLFVAGLFWAVSVLTRPKRLDKKLGLPLIGGSRTLKKDFATVIERGRQMYPDQPFIVNSSGKPFVVYPPSNFDEIKRLSEEEASAQDFFYDATHGYWTSVGTETPALWKTIGIDLARAGAPVVSTKQKDARTAFDRYVGYCPDEKSFNVFDVMMKVVALTNGASFVGREVAGGRWHELVAQLPMTVYFAVIFLTWTPRLFRPFLEPLFFLPHFKVQRDMRRILEPIIKQDLDEWSKTDDKKEQLKVKEGQRLPYHKWLISRYGPGEATPRQLATDQIVTAFESTISTALTIYYILFQLASRPELQDELRQEIADNTTDGQLPSTSLTELRKMDSVMRESFRVNPFALFSLYRITRKPLQLSTGPKLPAGTIFCVDVHHINNSSALFPAPTRYDPHRFLNKREQPGAEHRHQFVSTGPMDPNFGDGTQACPGRFWANNTIKVCLVHVLTRYRLKLKEGHTRPQPVCIPNGSWVPDLKAEVIFQSLD